MIIHDVDIHKQNNAMRGLIFALTLFGLIGVFSISPSEAAQPSWSPQAGQARHPARPATIQPRSISQRRTHVSRFRNWEALWRAVWMQGSKIYPIRAAATVRKQSLCRGNVGRQVNAIVMGTARAINAGRYGDAARSLAAFQDKLMCIDVRSMRTLDYMMAAFMANASLLPAKQKKRAMTGMLNMSLLVFDQIQYTGKSYSLPVLYRMRNGVKQALATYNGDELGIWFYDYRSGSMERRTFGRKDVRFRNGLMSMVADPRRFRNGACSILEMAGQGFSCAGIPGDGGGGGGGGSMPAAGGGMLGCMTAAAVSGGLHGHLQCMVRSGSGGGFDAGKGHPGIMMKGVLDGFCGGKTGEDPADEFTQVRPSDHENASKAGKSILDNFLSWFSENNSSSETAQTDGGPSAQRKECMKDFSGHNPGCVKKLEKYDESKGSSRGKGMSANAGTGCGAATNAVARANRLFNCSGVGSNGRAGGRGGPFSGSKSPGTRSKPQAGSGGGAGGSGMSGLMSCAMQGGSLVRTSMNDRRCSHSMCAPGQNCACDGGGGSAPPEVRRQVQRSIFSPNRANVGAKDPQPGGGASGGPVWGGGRSGPTGNPFGGRGPQGGR